MSDDDMKICPVCDANIPANSKKCPYCGVVTEFFAQDEDVPEFQGGEERFKNMVYSLQGSDEEDIIEGLRRLGQGSDEGDELIVFECPVCQANVAEDDSVCPSCGAIFEERPEDDKKEELEGLINEVRAKLSQCRETNFDLTVLKNYMRTAVKAEKKEDYGEGIKAAGEALSVSEKMLSMFDLLNQSKERLKSMKELGLEFAPHLEKIKTAKKQADSGDLEEAMEAMDSVMDEMESVMREHEISEKRKEIDPVVKPKLDKADLFMEELQGSEFSTTPLEDLRSEIDRDLEVGEFDGVVDKADKLLEMIEKSLRVHKLFMERKSRIESSGVPESKAVKEEVPNVIKDFSSKIDDLEKALFGLEKEEIKREDLEDMLRGLKRILSVAEERGFHVQEGEDITSRAEELISMERYEEAMELLHEGEKQVEGAVMGEIKSRKESLEGDTDEEDGILSHLEDVERALEGGDMVRAMEAITAAEKASRDSRPGDDPVSDAISRGERMIVYANKIGFEVADSRDLLKEAKKLMGEGMEDQAVEKAENAVDDILDQVPNHLKTFVKKAHSELRIAKISGMDISEHIALLKEAALAREKRDFEKCFECMKEYHISMGNR